MPEIQLSDFYVELIGFIITLLFSLMIKDAVASFLEGMKFRLNPHFKEGDKVILDGEQAMIIKIGWTQSVFGIYSKLGYTWRFIPNKKIENLKLEKIVDANLHPDTKEERAQKLLDMLEFKK